MELPLHIPSPGRRMWALGRLLPVPKPQAGGRKAPRNPSLAEGTPGSKNPEATGQAPAFQNLNYVGGASEMLMVGSFGFVRGGSRVRAGQEVYSV